MPAQEFAAILSELKPTFIHHARSKQLLRAVIDGDGCVIGEHTGLQIGLTGFGRLRPRNADTTGTVMG